MALTEIIGAVGSIAGVGGVITGVYYTYKAKSKELDTTSVVQAKANEQAMIDQLQQQLEAYDVRFNAADKKYEALEAKVDRLVARDTLSRQFIWKLINHINKEQGPPAPDWPEGLL